MQFFLEEFQTNIQAGDLIKAQVLLSYLHSLEPQMQQRVLFELSRCDAHVAIPLLGYVLAHMDDLAVTQESVCEVLCDKILDAPEDFLKLLDSSELQGNVRLIELAGSMQLKVAVPNLIALLARETRPEGLVALLKALGAIGDAAAVDAVAEYLYADTHDLVSTAVQALAQLATPEAVQYMADRLGHDSELDRLILKLFAEMDNDLGLDKLAETLGAPQATARNYAKMLLQRVGARAIPVLSRCLGDTHTDVVIHALNTLGAISDANAVPPVRKLLHNEPQDANVRFAAYEALGMLPLHKGVFVLAEGLEDPVEDVRIAASRAIEHHTNDIIIAGISNLVHQADEKAQQITQAILNAKAERLFLSLMNDAIFEDMALSYLTTQAHPELRGYFETLLRRQGYSADADKLSRNLHEPSAAGRLVIYAVDDSRMILNIYKKTLYQLGYEAHLFEYPASALAQIQRVKPDIVFTDLNMPEITGIELTETLRTQYTKEDLPIVMVTTQSEGQDHDAAHSAGVNMILHKPFTTEQLDEVIAQQVRRESDR